MVRGGASPDQRFMKHTNTQLCVDSLPLFLPICPNRPIIPLRSARGGQTVPVQQRLPHLVEPNSGIILAYGWRRIEQRGVPVVVVVVVGGVSHHCTGLTRLRVRRAELL